MGPLGGLPSTAGRPHCGNHLHHYRRLNTDHPIATAVVTIGTTIGYGSPINLQDSCRGSWLQAELNRLVKLAPATFVDTILEYDIKLTKNTHPLLAACKVIALTPETVAYLEASDPQALKQLRAAITEADGSNPEQQVNEALINRAS